MMKVIEDNVVVGLCANSDIGLDENNCSAKHPFDMATCFLWNEEAFHSVSSHE